MLAYWTKTQPISSAVYENPTEVTATVSCAPATQNSPNENSNVVLDVVQIETELIVPVPTKSKRKKAKKVRKAPAKSERTEPMRVGGRAQSSNLNYSSSFGEETSRVTCLNNRTWGRVEDSWSEYASSR